MVGNNGNGAYTGLYTLNMLDRELGSALFSADFKSPRFNTPQGLEALTYAQQLYQVMVPGGATPTKSFDDRGAAMMWWYGQPYTANLDPSQIDQLRLARIPAPTAGGNTIAVANSWGWMISPQANSPQAAAKVIEVFLSPEVQQSLLAAWGPAAVLSPRRDVSDPSDSPLTRQYAAMTVPPISDWGPTHPLANDVNRIAEPIIEQAVEGKLPLGSALAQVDDLLASEFKSKGFTQ